MSVWWLQMNYLKEKALRAQKSDTLRKEEVTVKERSCLQI